MSAPEPGAAAGAARIGPCALDVIELAACAGRAGALRQLAATRGLTLPALGGLTRHGGGLVLAVRPERWLLLLGRGAPGASHAAWAEASAGLAAAVDLSDALAAFHVAGVEPAAWRAAGCRLDLERQAEPGAAATSVAQSAVILVRIPGRWLLLGPSTLAAHLAHWLAHDLAHGTALQAPCPLADWLGDETR